MTDTQINPTPLSSRLELSNTSDTIPFSAPNARVHNDHVFDIVITSIDPILSSSLTQTITSSLSPRDLYGYQVEFIVTKNKTSYSIQRPLETFYHVLQTTIQSATHVERDTSPSLPRLPTFPSKLHRHNDSILAQWCTEMTAFLATCWCTSRLQRQEEWLDFIAERDNEKGARMHMTAIDFILQPFPMEKCYISRGSRQEVMVQVKADEMMMMMTNKEKTGELQYLVWKFELEEYDIDFSVMFIPELPEMEEKERKEEEPFVDIVHARTRYVSTTTGQAIEGVYQCIQPGKARLVWDNSYSRLRGKNVLYQIQVVSSKIMESATAAADALDEALRAEKARDEERNEALSTALVVSPAKLDANECSAYSAYIPEAIAQQSWLLSAPMNVAGHLVSKLFGAQDTTAMVPLSRTQHNAGSDSEARSLLEELNGLNMQLMERMESHEDNVAKLTAERDQERSKTQMALVEKENLANEVKVKEQELAAVAGELQRIQREREAWRVIQAERDALLEEKHRWAMTDDFNGSDEEASNVATDMDSATRIRLEKELGKAEAAVLRCRAELGYSLNNHLTGTSTRLEKIAREMATTKQQYEEQMQTWECDRLQLTQHLVKARGQRRVLITEVRNMRTQTEGQIAVAMAEASEARMVNKSLKKQNELLLTQIRALINEGADMEKKFQDVRDELMQQQQQRQDSQLDGQARLSGVNQTENEVAMLDLSVKCEQPSFKPQPEIQYLDSRTSQSDDRQETTTEGQVDASPVPYTLNEDDIAILSGHRRQPSTSSGPAYDSYQTQYEDVPPIPPSSSKSPIDLTKNPYRARLITFLTECDPEKLPEVDEMLTNYKGVEESLFKSLELKYNFMALNQRIAQVL